MYLGGGTNLVDLMRLGVAAPGRLVQDIDAVWIDERDPHLNPMGVKGIGEIGIVGTVAAIDNDVWHAAGRRIRDLPVTPAKILSS